MGCRFSHVNPGLNIYDARLENGNGVFGVDPNGNLLMRPIFATPNNPATTDYGDPVWFACRDGKSLALDGQILNLPAYLYNCPDSTASRFTDVNIGTRLSCV